MIKANELRIGNWITGDDGNHVQVYNIMNKADDWYVYNSGIIDGMVDSYIRDPKPIPLTPELLEQYGFTYHNGLYSLMMRDDSVLFVSHSEGTAFISQQSYHDAAGNAPCEFLHQLQNLYFALTGEELEVKATT